ncbi:AAA family ATPase [Amycolatopsis benzoatilytica]|uniref:AAA family ATPase n=1 Tax=Amycolatopsis benzoatilytica TaxID=346045 RepID=UPI000363C515|nr:LuxR family transcriptional regulator [Amycolatopsis benzoatilytica]
MLLERESALAQLDCAVRGVDAGAGAVVVIGGAAGTGKTALLRQLATIADRLGARVLHARGAGPEADFPLGVVRQLALPSLSAPDEPEIPLVARKLLRCLGGGFADEAAEHDTQPAMVLHGLHALIAAFARQRTVLVLVDDLQWADEPSLRALVFLAARLSGMRLLVGVVLPDGAGRDCPLIREIAASAGHRVRAVALSPAATGELVGRRFGPALEPEFVRACHEITDGCPKELGSLLDSAFSHRLSGRAEEAEQVRALGGAVRAERLRSVLGRDPAAAALAKAVVVLGVRAEHRLPAMLSGLDARQYAAAREVLEGRWLTAAGEVLAVRDPAIARVIEGAMSARESASLHRAAAALLAENGYPVEEVIGHVLRVDSTGGRGEAGCLRAAATDARRRGEPDTAARYLRWVLRDQPTEDADRAWLLAELADAEFDAGSAVAVRHLAQAASLLEAARDRAAVIARSPLSIAAAGPLIAELVRDVSEDLGPAEELHHRDRELSLRLEARAWYAALPDRSRLAGAVARLRSLPVTPVPSAAERELRTVLLLAGTLSERLSRNEVLAPIVQILDHQPAHWLQARAVMPILPAILVAVGEAGRALSWLDAAGDYPQLRAGTVPRAMVDAQRAFVLLAQGRLAEGKEHAVRACDAVATQESDVRVLPEHALGVAAFLLRDKALAGRVFAAPESSDDPWQFLIRRSLRAIAAAVRGDFDAARAHFTDCGRYFDRIGWCNPALLRWREPIALLSHRLGRVGEAKRVAEENYERSIAWGEPVGVARSLRIRAVVHGGEPAVRWLRESLELMEGSGNPFEQAKTLVSLGERIRETDVAEADRLLRLGQKLAEQSGASWLSARAGRHAVRSAVATETPRRTGLTRGEATVAELAAHGHTNTEIAETLGICRRAVEKQLTGVYRKLRIGGRAGLADALGQARAG